MKVMYSRITSVWISDSWDYSYCYMSPF